MHLGRHFVRHVHFLSTWCDDFLLYKGVCGNVSDFSRSEPSTSFGDGEAILGQGALTASAALAEETLEIHQRPLLLPSFSMRQHTQRRYKFPEDPPVWLFRIPKICQALGLVTKACHNGRKPMRELS